RRSGTRLRRELELLLGVDAGDGPATALAGLERLQELGVLGAVHPRLAASAEWPVAWRRLLDAAAELAWYRAAGAAHTAGAAHAAGPRRPARQWLLLLLALAAGLDEDERDDLAARLLLAGEERRLLTGFGGRLTAAPTRLRA